MVILEKITEREISGSDFSRDHEPGHPRPVCDPSPRTTDYSKS